MKYHINSIKQHSMQAMNCLLIFMIIALLSGCTSGGKAPRAQEVNPPVNNNGSPISEIFTALFDPTNAVIPFPSNLLLSGTTDLTLNIPVSDPNDFSNPQVALSALDGFSTTAPITTTFSGALDEDSVMAGDSVRVFEVELTGPGGGVIGVNQELTPYVDYIAAVASSDSTGGTLAVVPLRPLQQLTSYMVVITDEVNNENGTDSTPAQTYFIAKRTEPLVDGSGNSTDPLLGDATANALEPLRQLINSQEFAAQSMGMNREDIVVSWTFTTQSVSVVSGVLASVITASPAAANTIVWSGLNTGDIGLNGIADIYLGMIDFSYFLEAPTVDNPTGPITGFWQAAPGAYVPPFDALGLDPTSTNLTFANPLPVEKSIESVPMLITTPNVNSGFSQPDSGWPVAIFQHGITRDRTDMLAISESLASAGFAVIAIDQPLHGVTDQASPFYVENGPFMGMARERTFDVDYIDNATSAPGPDGIIDDSGVHYVNLSSLLSTRDNLRQSETDLIQLAMSVSSMDLDGDSIPDLDGSRVHFVGQSLGGIVGIPFIALYSSVNVATLSVPGGQLAYLFAGSPSFGPQVEAGLAANGVLPGTPDFSAFLVATQTVVDSADPINYAELASQTNSVLLQEVVGGPDFPSDQVVPNNVPGAPLAGTDPLIAIMQLPTIIETTTDPLGVNVVTKFTDGSHGVLLDPTASVAATVEAQGQMVSFIASDGQSVVISNPAVLSGE